MKVLSRIRAKFIRIFYCGRTLSMLFVVGWMYLLLPNDRYAGEHTHSSDLPTGTFSQQCHFKPATTKFILQYETIVPDEVSSLSSYVEPSVVRIRNLLEIIRLKEDQYQPLLETFGVFDMLNPKTTLNAYTDETNIREIRTLYKRFIQLMPDQQTVSISADFITYLKKLSSYLTDGLRNNRSDKFGVQCHRRPAFIFACDSGYFDKLQQALHSHDNYWPDHRIVFYDLGITKEQHAVLRQTCVRCTIIKFPFSSIENYAVHIRTLRHYVYKPFVIQDALRRYGTIIYADTSIRFNGNPFESVLIDNYIRGFAANEMPRHSLPCSTRSRTFEWFNQSYQHYENIFIAKTSLLVVTDTFLTRLIMKAWLTCALEIKCLLAFSTESNCGGQQSGTHYYERSAITIILTHFFFPNNRSTSHDKNFHDPAPYDMSTSIQTPFVESIDDTRLY